MRKLPEPTEQETIEGPQAVSFQIANGNARQSCILQTTFPTKLQAQRYLLANWPTIDKMLATRSRWEALKTVRSSS